MKKGDHLYGYQSLMQQSLHNLRLDCKCFFSLLVMSAQDMDVQLYEEPAENRLTAETPGSKSGAGSKFAEKDDGAHGRALHHSATSALSAVNASVQSPVACCHHQP